jgi:flagellar basal body-associated protein FliL
MTDQQNEAKPKRSFSIVGLLRTVAIILAVIVFLSTAITNLLMVYIIFGPDEMPKPFYLMYYLPGQTPQLPVASGVATPMPSAGKTPNPEGKNAANTNASENNSNGTMANGQIQPGQGIMMDTGSKIVNLADPSGRTFIKTTIVLEFAPNNVSKYLNKAVPTSAAAEGAAAAPLTSESQTYTTTFKEELTTRMPVINDVIITLLGTKKYDQIYTSEGKETLRQELMQALNTRLVDYKVIQVYFTEFVVQ